MSLRELGGSVSPSSAPLTRRELREREEALRAAEAKPVYYEMPTARPPVAQSTTIHAPAQTRRARGAAPKATPAPKKKPAQRVASHLLSLGALIFAGALLVAVSVPANAFISDSAVALPDVQARQVDGLPNQSLAVPDEAIGTVLSRDSYSITSYAELLRAQYGNAGTFSATTGAVRWPFPYSVPTTDGFGPRPIWISGNAFHNGVDFTPGGGTPIYAIADGVVTTAVDSNLGYGTHVIIQHDIPGVNLEALYAHMRSGSSPLKVGDVVKVGDFLGLVGDTGVAYGEHLHFEIHIDKVPVDPFAWLTANAVN